MTASVRERARRLSLAALFLSAVPGGLAQAQEEPPPPPPPRARERRERPSHEADRPDREASFQRRHEKGAARPYERMMAMLKERHPEEYARLVELHRTDPEAFRKELEMKVHRAREAYEKRAKARMNQGGPEQERRPVVRLMALLKEKNPEEFERLQKLRQEDPKAFREALHDMLRRARDEKRNAPEGAPPPEEPRPNPC